MSEPETTDPRHASKQKVRLDRHRYRRLRWFFLRTFLQGLWWDGILNRPFLRRFRRDPLKRWSRKAVQFRALAVEMGGVLIKLGQFISVRVDLLPREITQILAGLQDEVPAVAFEEIRASIESDLPQPVDDLFASIDPNPIGAASLAQVHRVVLRDGQQAVVKALRPGIEVLVETDLAALGQALGWLRIWRRLGRRVNIDRVFQEFSQTTRSELDLSREIANIERFRHEFEEQDDILVPEVFPEASGRRTLTLSDVGAIKISDLEALDAAGVDRKKLAQRLHDAYMHQIFVSHFIHCDPHPGNLFVHPRTSNQLDGDEAADDEPRFAISFVDFGMVTTVPTRLQSSVQEYVFAMAKRDPRRLVEVLDEAGVLLPGADLDRLEEASSAIFDRFWGVRMAELRDVALAEAGGLFREFRDLVFEAPVQFPADMLFVMRSIGMLFGLVTQLDPEFDSWSEMMPFAEKLAARRVRSELKTRVAELADTARATARIPVALDRALRRADRGGIAVRSSMAPDMRNELRRLQRSADRLSLVITASALLLGGVLLKISSTENVIATVLISLAGLMFLWSLRPRS